MNKTIYRWKGDVRADTAVDGILRLEPDYGVDSGQL